MPDESLYVYGIVKSEVNVDETGQELDWKQSGIKRNEVYMVQEGKFSALVHNCEQKPYLSQDVENIKELIITHNMILDKAMNDFNGVIPLHFNTIIKKGEHSAHSDLKRWLNDEQEKLEKIWKKIKGKKEYGLRTYYEKDKLIEEISKNVEIKKLEQDRMCKSQGLSYLLQAKVKFRINELLQEKIIQFKQEFNKKIKKIANEVIINVSRITIDEEKNLLVSFSFLIEEKKMEKIKEYLEKKEIHGFSFHLAGPFAPYSFVENG